MAKWRTLEEYSPFARLLVEYMWEQRPPLLPNQFAAQLSVRKQQVSTWLNSEAVPPPPILVRLARGMGKPVRELLVVAGYATAEDPLLDRVDAWDEVLRAVAQAPEVQRLAPDQHDALLTLLHTIQARACDPVRASEAGSEEEKMDAAAVDLAASESDTNSPGL